MTHPAPAPHVGTADWSIPRATVPGLPGEGSHLQRYARVLNCAEINSSFSRSHRTEVYARWAEQTPPEFRFAVKLPCAFTHEGKLLDAGPPLQRFMAQASGLGARLAVLLVQLPPSLAFEPRSVDRFFSWLANLSTSAVVCEPRHASWFTPRADGCLVERHIGRAAADPARWPAAATPGGWLGPAGDGVGHASALRAMSTTAAMRSADA